MDRYKLEIAQMLKEHPILCKGEAYKRKYINFLEYFTRKFSENDEWANATLALYKKALLKSPRDYTYEGPASPGRKADAAKIKPFKVFSYRYCAVTDCVFINAFNDRKKGERLYAELAAVYNERYRKNLRRLYECLFDPELPSDGFEQAGRLIDRWRKNEAFLKDKPVRVIVTATMSAGKSTLLNALVGKKINRTRNDACTSKIHFIRNKPYEDGYSYESDYALELDADLRTLMDDNSKNADDRIDVGTFFRTLRSAPKRVWLIDTPGVNSSQDKEHKDITEKCIKNTPAELLLYILNGANIGSDDDRAHLQFVLDNYKGKTVFVVNKLDKFRKKEDSVPETLAAVREDLKKMGFVEPLVVPISSSAAYLAKMSIFGEELDEEDQDEFALLSRKLKSDGYRFDAYYPISGKDVELDENSEAHMLLRHSGVLQLEKIIYETRG